MIEALLQTLFGPLGGILAGSGAVVLALIYGRSQGRKTQQQEDKADALDRVDKGTRAVNRGGDPAKRLRDNDGRWK